MNFKNTQTASKQSLYYRKANSSQDSQEGENESLSLLSHRGFYPLKMGVTNMGSRKMCFFSHWPCPLPMISPCPIGVLAVEMSCKSYGFFALLFPQTESQEFRD